MVLPTGRTISPSPLVSVVTAVTNSRIPWLRLPHLSALQVSSVHRMPAAMLAHSFEQETEHEHPLKTACIFLLTRLGAIAPATASTRSRRGGVIAKSSPSLIRYLVSPHPLATFLTRDRTAQVHTFSFYYMH